MSVRRGRYMALVMFVFVALVFAATPRGALAQLQFGTRLYYGTGNSPQGLAVGDLNKDGRPDIVTADYLDGKVSVLLQNTDGTFQTKTDYPVGAAPMKVALADLDRDGSLDIVSADRDGSTVTVLLGNGSGGFGVGTPYPTGSGASSVFVADFNRDGRPDLAVADKNADAVSILLGIGNNGAFGPRTDYDTDQNPSSVVAADFNNDGKLDLAAANTGHATITIRLGYGDGTFGPRTDFPAGYYPLVVVAADLDSDGKMDLVTTSLNNDASVLLGNGDGTFGPDHDYPLGGGGYPEDTAVGDLDGDGIPDLAVACSSTHTVAVLLGRGDGTFATGVNFSSGSAPTAVRIGDVNGDGEPDLVLTNNDPNNTVSILTNTSADFFSGLPHDPVGGATLATGNGNLTVSNIGSSGNDGVSIGISRMDGIGLVWGGTGLNINPPADSGAVIVTQLMGRVGGSPSEVSILALRQEVKGNRVVLTCSTPYCTAPAESLRVFYGGTEVEAVGFPNGWQDVTMSGQGGVAIKEKGVQIAATSISQPGVEKHKVVGMKKVTVIEPLGIWVTVGSTTVLGDEIDFICPGSSDSISVTRAQITAIDPGETITHTLTIGKESVNILGASVTSIGNASLAATLEPIARLQVFTPNEGSGISCGTIDPVEGVKQVSSAWIDVSMLAPDSLATLQPGASMSLRAIGVLGGVPDLQLDRIDQIKNEYGSYECKNYTAAKSNTAAVYFHGGLVHTWMSPSDTIATIERLSTNNAYNVSIPSIGGPGSDLRWPGGTVLTVGGVPYIVDQLQVGLTPGAAMRPAPAGRLEAPTTLQDGVTSLEVTAKGIGSFVITGFTSEPLPTTSGVPEAGASGAPRALLASAWPNPSSGDVKFAFMLPAAGLFRAEVYDASGRIVRRLRDRALSAGSQLLAWDGRTDAGAQVPQGVYFVRGRLAQAGRAAETASDRLVILR
jgi:hypothetical protein